MRLIPIGLVVTMTSFGGAPAAHAGAGDVEVTRGSTTGGSSSSRARERDGVEIVDDNGIEILYGIETGAERVDFETDGYTLSSSERRSIRLDVLAMIDIYDAELGVQVGRDFGVEVDILGDSGQFEERFGSRGNFTGFYSHETREAVVSGAGSIELVHRTALHESSHSILGDRVPRAPTWLNEGLAEYFENIERNGGWVDIPAQPERRKRLLAGVESGAEMPLETLLQMGRRRWTGLDEASVQRAYSHAWALVYFLMEDEGRREVVSRLLADFAGGASGSSSAALLERHYPGGLKAFDREWRTWLPAAARGHRY